jgi:LysM repeat protein
MEEKLKKENKKQYRTCPFLGQKTDPETALSYPSPFNRCYHARLVASIEFGDQDEFCLTSRYSECKVISTRQNIPSLAGNRLRKQHGNNKSILWITLLVIVLVSLGINFAWRVIASGKGLNQILITPTRYTELTETKTGITSPFQEPTITPSPTSILSGAVILRPALALEIPLGIDQKFIIHQIQEGDSLNLLAGRNGTTVEALQACNYRLHSPLLPGWVIVIPVDIVYSQDLPAFEVYSVTEDISLEALATLLSVDLNEFKYYNALNDDFVPRTGDWLLVPRSNLPTPS